MKFLVKSYEKNLFVAEVLFFEAPYQDSKGTGDDFGFVRISLVLTLVGQCITFRFV